MDKKEIQKQRMMNYFISAAKEIILEEGVKGLSVRKVGDRAGYSYATIYNYFTDLNTLLFYCVFDFLEDCYKYLISFKDESIDIRQQVLINTVEYFRYFATHPDIFKLVFIEDLGGASTEILEQKPQPSVALLLRESILECARAGYIKEESIEVITQLISSSVHGKLLFYVQDRLFDEFEIEGIIEIIKKEVEFLLINYKR